MKLIFILRSLTLSGGLERVFCEKANWLARHDHTVLFLTCEQGTHPLSFELDSNVQYDDLNCRYFTIYHYHFFKRLFLMFKIRKKFGNGLSRIIRTYDPDAIVVPHNMVEYYTCLTSLCSCASIIIENHSAYPEFMGAVDSFKLKLQQRHFKKLVSRCRMVLSLTAKDASYWRDYNTNVRYIPNPIICYPNTIHESSRVEGRIICVSRLMAVKRIDRLIEAFSLIAGNYPQWHIVIYGDGVEKDGLESLIHKLKLEDRITINAPTQNIFYEYLRSQFLALTSDSEGFSLVIAEAMACGLPVVSTNCPFGPSEIIEDGETGLLTSMDARDFALKMEWMIIHEKERKEMGHKARVAAARYKEDVIMKEWEEAYLSVLNYFS